MKDFFKWDDFKDFFSIDNNTSAGLVADVANEKLNELIESWPVVHSTEPCNFWAKDTIKQFVDPEITHKARLAFMEVIVKETCKHEPMEASGAYAFFPFCKHCGVELTLIWSEKK